jgi:cytidylate kinase
VIIGRCADYALAENPNLLRLFIYAPMKDRVQRVAERQSLSPEKAKTLIRKTDRRRASYYEYYTSHGWGETESYDFCLNSSSLGLGGTVELIRSIVEQRENPVPSPTEHDPTRENV